MAKRIEEFKPEPDPMAQMQQKLEIELLKAKIANEKASAVEDQAGGILDLAKAETEKVKAKQMKSDADLKDLDFVERESGVAQARDIEKQGAQARSNMELESHKAGLKGKEELLKNLLQNGAPETGGSATTQ